MAEFKAEYFQGEEIDGFYVDSMMKRAWAATIEVFEVIDRICKKYQLQYFADWGTLLGAIRHKGIIPWDDDIDICMKRKDYNELIRILPSELPYGFVVAGMYAESERLQNAAYVPHLRVIADETLWDFNSYMKRFHGFPYQRIGIDISPLDALPDDENLAYVQKEIIRQGILILREWDNIETTGELQGYLKGFGEACKVEIPQRKDIKNWMWRFIDKICSLYEREDAVELTSFNVWSRPYHLKKEWYEEAIYVPFQNITMPVPREYDKVLKHQFGDYMVPVQGGAGHDYPFYGSMEEELIKQIRAVGFTGTVEEFCEKVCKGELQV